MELLNPGIGDSMQVRPVEFGSGPAAYLAQIALSRRVHDLRGHSFELTVLACALDLDRQAASARCWGECVERVTACSPEALVSHVRESQRSDERDTLWSDFAPYQPNLRAQLQAHEASDFSLRAIGMCSGAAYSVPASRVMLFWDRFQAAGGKLAECDASGLAGRPVHDGPRCETAALLEVLERDAAMMAWRHEAWPIGRVGRNALDPRLRAIVEQSGFRLRLYDVGDPLLAPVAVALLYSEEAGGLTCGTACDLDLSRACTKATLEALMLWNSVRHAGQAGPGNDDDVVGSIDHVRWGYQHWRYVLGWFERHPLAELRTYAANDTLAERCARRFGAEPLLVDLSCPAVKADWRVVRVLVPNAMRKEWSHRRRFWTDQRPVGYQDGSARGTHEAPHPYG